MENHLQELEWKESNDRKQPSSSSVKRVSAEGPVIVGAGPSGLAVAACLKERGIPSVILERSNCIASLWQHRTYDRLRLHLPKKFCQLPLFPFPSSFPTYPTKEHFIAYLDSYARHFGLNPSFNTTVVSAGFDGRRGCWAVKALTRKEEEVVEYACRWLIVATGENAEAVVPEIDGMDDFIGEAVHSNCYKSGVRFKHKRVLVVGCGNSGMEVCLDLCNHNAHPSLVVRDAVHVLPQKMLGTSTFGLSMSLLKWFPIRVVDRFLLLVSRLMLGDTARLGLSRPAIGPMQWKDVSGKTPVLDIGTLEKITAGNIKVFPEIKKMTRRGAEFIDGRTEEFDAIIFATGYRSNVSYWLKKECNMLSGEKDGFPVQSFPDGGWKGENGLYAVGFAKRGLPGASLDARRIADDIERTWKSRERRRMDCGHARIVPTRGAVELSFCDN